MREWLRKRLGELLVKFDPMVKMVRQDCKAKNALVGGGHGFSDHDLVVGQYCLQIAPEPLATLAWVGAMLHSTDRHHGDQMVEPMVKKYLVCTDFSDGEKQTILEAVLNHSHKPNPSDNPVTVILMDADKLGNIGGLLALRSAQFQPTLPIIDLRYLDEQPPGTSFKKPGSIYWDIKSSLEWAEPGWIRTPKAQELAKPLFMELQKILDGIICQFSEIGLYPHPFPDDFDVKENS